MALHFIFGRAGTGKTRRCCEEIRRYMEGGGRRTALLIVPDQGTYMAEHMLAETFPSGGFIDVFATGFSRLAWRVFKELSLSPGDALSPLGQQLILRRLLTAHKDSFRVISKPASQLHFASSMTELFHEFDSYGITDAILAKAAAREGDTPLGRKLSDLACLFGAYHDYLRSHFHYQGNVFDLLTKNIPRSAFIRESRIWIDGFNGMTPQEADAVSALISAARDVTVTLPMDAPGDAAGKTTFDRPYRLWRALVSRAGGDPDREMDHPQWTAPVLAENHRFRAAGLASLERDYFASPAGKARSSEGLILTEAADRACEIDDMARSMVALARDKGIRYRDMTVLLRSPDKYEDHIKHAFARYGIPYFLDRRESMWNHPLVSFLDSLLRFLSAGEKGWQKEILFRLLKTGLLPGLSTDDIDRLENYVLRCGIRFYQWGPKAKRWTFRKLYDLDEPSAASLSQWERQQKARAEAAAKAEEDAMNDMRRRLEETLGTLSARWQKAPAVREKCTLLYEFLRKAMAAEKLAAMDEKEYARSRTRPHIQVWKQVMALLEELVRVAGNDALPPEEFLAMAEDGLRTMTYSMIPPTLDHVTVTTVDRGYGLSGKAVFLPGAVDGEFPSRTDEKGLITEAERKQLEKEQSLLLGPDLVTRIHQEQFYVYLALTRASDVLYLSRPVSDDDGRPLAPSFLTERLRQLGFAPSLRKALPLSEKTDDPLPYLVRPDQALSLLPRVLRAVQEGTALSQGWQPFFDWIHEDPRRKARLQEKLKSLSYRAEAEPLRPELAKALFTPGRFPFRSSISRLEQYRACPYKHFLQYGLRLSEREDGVVNAADFGSYLHAGLHLFGEALEKEGRQWRSMTDGDIDDLSSRIAARLAPKVRYGALKADEAAAYTESALNRTFRTALGRFRSWSRQSDFATESGKDLEHTFDNLALHDKETGKTYLLQGKIDRIDRNGKALAVIDYKTGHPEVSLNDILIGAHLQLITYLLKALEDSPGGPLSAIPAAFFYVYLSGNARTLSAPPGPEGIPKDSRQELNGYFLSDPDVLSALDREAGTDNAFIPVKFKKDGSSYSNSPALSREQMDILLQKAEEALVRLCRSISSGDIAIRPLKTVEPCRYCPYRAVCRFDQKLGCRYDAPPKRQDKDIKKDILIPDTEGGLPS